MRLVLVMLPALRQGDCSSLHVLLENVLVIETIIIIVKFKLC